MNRRIAAALGALALTFALSGAAFAHHSFAMFDVEREVTLDGTVKDFQWTNPHAWVLIVAKDGSGKEINWSIEASSPQNLVRYGWSRSSLKAGDRVRVVIHPLKSGQIGGSLVKISVNGQVIGAPKPS